MGPGLLWTRGMRLRRKFRARQRRRRRGVLFVVWRADRSTAWDEEGARI